MLEIVVEARKASISTGFEVRRILPFRLRRMVGPFIFMDHAGPLDVPPSTLRSLDVLPNPHIGLLTVSYLFGGQVTHRDSLGVQQIIRPGEVNWMTAGSGIAQLPESDEETAPAFENFKPERLPIFTDKGVWIRLIAGIAFGLKNSVKTHSPLFYIHVVLQKGTKFSLPTEYSERGIYVVKGSIEVGGRNYGIGQLLVFTPNINTHIVAAENSTFMLLGGEPLGQRFI